MEALTPGNAQRPQPPRPKILTVDEANRRLLLLTALQHALAVQRVCSVLARNQRLVLRAGGPWEPSGLTDPHLHIFLPNGTDIATTDGITYRFANGRAHPADDLPGTIDSILQVRALTAGEPTQAAH